MNITTFYPKEKLEIPISILPPPSNQNALSMLLEQAKKRNERRLTSLQREMYLKKNESQERKSFSLQSSVRFLKRQRMTAALQSKPNSSHYKNTLSDSKISKEEHNRSQQCLVSVRKGILRRGSLSGENSSLVFIKYGELKGAENLPEFMEQKRKSNKIFNYELKNKILESQTLRYSEIPYEEFLKTNESESSDDKTEEFTKKSNLSRYYFKNSFSKRIKINSLKNSDRFDDGECQGWENYGTEHENFEFS